MVYGGFDKDRNRLKWRCPKVAGSRHAKPHVPLGNTAGPSCAWWLYRLEENLFPTHHLRTLLQTRKGRSTTQQYTF
ncbi:MAG: hypothetical protein AB1497_08615, partial [Bacillota bacterium]